MMSYRYNHYAILGITIATTLFYLTMEAYAQVPRWSLHPKYASIKMLGNGNYLVSDNGKYGMMNSSEKEVVPLKYDKVTSFSSHTALLYNNNQFVGYISDQGRVKEIPAGKYGIAQPSFLEGYLLVSNIGGYYYLRASDDKVIGPFTGGMPFTEGYAVVKKPKSLKKVLDGDYTFQVLSAKTGEPEALNLGDYEENDIDFISGVSNGKSIIVLKKRFHEYDFNKQTLTPIHFDGNAANKKSRVFANERPVNVMGDEKGFLVQFKQGEMAFDSLMRLRSITYTGQEKKEFDIAQEVKEEKKSSLNSSSFPGTDLLGLKYNGEVILSAQFEKVSKVWGNEALVMVNGKYGIVTVDPNQKCRFVLNDNMAIGFEHKTIYTSIKAVCPPYMNPALMSLSSEDENCHINVDTRKESKNVETAVLSYQCVLNIPDEIGLEKSSTDTKFTLNYDGLKLTPKTIPYDTWYVNNYSIQITKHATEGSVLTAEILVNNSSQSGKNFFREVTVEAEDSVQCNLTKINEDIYSIRFFGMKDGTETLRFTVDITEDGCPTLSYARSIAISTNKKTEKPIETEPPVTAQAKIKRKISKPKAATPKKEEKKIITHF